VKNGTKLAKKEKENVTKIEEKLFTEKHPHFSRFFRFFRFSENHAIFREKFREKYARAKFSRQLTIYQRTAYESA
jgi:hypothetical protein